MARGGGWRADGAEMMGEGEIAQIEFRRRYNRRLSVPGLGRALSGVGEASGAKPCE